MKTCPVCKEKSFDDAEVCYGCLYRFAEGESNQSAIAGQLGSGLACGPQAPHEAVAQGLQVSAGMDTAESRNSGTSANSGMNANANANPDANPNAGMNANANANMSEGANANVNAGANSNALPDVAGADGDEGLCSARFDSASSDSGEQSPFRSLQLELPNFSNDGISCVGPRVTSTMNEHFANEEDFLEWTFTVRLKKQALCR